ncbi:bifunctional methylenetetrahydrofolate dehydrogenase/methenyltetrahydrofolate cyclohydrolase FolD [bacterium]|nr:bifunctional methylenetetrahydrofolate dehydrogenase/methenyltetrahydrofolate cyclohydrolase FolD [bacterium]MBU1153313.1 bifunctional methylenetetrahydrofolate dehydrogenase/methenyltetrahydrofolate cyclohydrolase FolD [bacterium]MBU2600068.1 bifunctional methylenetetrahydrofolate dehydrogenase/methenyltetrahydrofolate cyclohydrolase FolD [bacterium]
MGAKILSGSEIAKEIREELKKEVEDLKNKGVIPGLATILIGSDPASQVYVGQKTKTCHNLGIFSDQYTLPAETNEEELLSLINKLNNDPKIDGILTQLPLPKQINELKVLNVISPEKDVDGFHPINVGKFFTVKDFNEMMEKNLFLPCTPHGIIEILKRSNLEISGKEAVVVGRSNIVGKPIAMLLLANNATVTVCHSKTSDLPAVCRRADILIAAIGKAKFVTADMVKEGSCVIDVGVNRTKDGLVGDVDFEKVTEVAGSITPVPGGVGPMTITMLMVNVVKSAKKRLI